MMNFMTIARASLFCLFFMRGVSANPVTLYRVAYRGEGSPKDGLSTILNLTAVGLGPDGGVTYSEVAVVSGFVTLAVGSASITTVIAPTVTATDVFVENSAWVFESVPDSSHKFNNFEQNCTLNANKDASECVAVVRNLVGGTSTSTFATTFAATPVAYYTYTGALPTKTSASLPRFTINLCWGILSAISLTLASAYF